MSPERPAIAQPRLVLLVFLGGVIGSAGREGAALLIPAGEGVPWPVFGVNVVGSFLLAVLVTALGERATETARQRDVRLFAGTGVLGGFTTYSALAATTVVLGDADLLLAALWAVGSVVAGLVAAWLGLLAGTALSRSDAAA